MILDKKKYCTFYIVRHGETVWNVEQRVQGQKDSPLTEIGFKQARKLAKILKKIKFEHIYSSDLLRAKRTAEIIALEHDMVVTSKKVLRECSFGRFAGRKTQKVREELKKEFEKLETLSKKQRFKFKFHEEIESDEELMSRFITFLREVALAYPGKKVLIITHGKVMRIFLIHLGFGDYSQFPIGSIKNAAYVVVDCDGVDFFIKETFGVNKKEQVRS